MVRATLMRLRFTPSIWVMVARIMWKNSATTTMKIAGPLPMPNRKIATGSQAIGDTGASSVIGRQGQPLEQPEIADRHAGGRLPSAKAITSPASTRPVDDSTV